MSEAIQARETGQGKDRCPFCHEEFAAATAERVHCAGCGTPHHAECFAENEGCSALGCERAVARVKEGVELPAPLLHPDLEQARALATQGGRDLLSLRFFAAGAFLFAMGLALAAVGAGRFAWFVAVLGGLLVLVASSMRALGGVAARAPTTPPEEVPLPFAPTRAPLHGADILQGVLNRPVGPPVRPEDFLEPTGPATKCPSCGQELEAGAELAFCYHCGASVR